MLDTTQASIKDLQPWQLQNQPCISASAFIKVNIVTNVPISSDANLYQANNRGWATSMAKCPANVFLDSKWILVERVERNNSSAKQKYVYLSSMVTADSFLWHLIFYL